MSGPANPPTQAEIDAGQIAALAFLHKVLKEYLRRTGFRADVVEAVLAAPTPHPVQPGTGEEHEATT